MKLNWFRRIGIIYIPARPAGWIIMLIALAYAIYIFIDIDSRSHSVSDTMINFMLNFFIIGAVYTLVAFVTGTGERNIESENKES
ncbi:MAG TPA: hypothetical protein VJ963_08795 [Bacteroidales bacterium]|nr:hypothetical protein [Bacteroidales bacterium]